MDASFPNTAGVEWTWKLRLFLMVRVDGQHGERLSHTPVIRTGPCPSCFPTDFHHCHCGILLNFLCKKLGKCRVAATSYRQWNQNDACVKGSEDPGTGVGGGCSLLCASSKACRWETLKGGQESRAAETVTEEIVCLCASVFISLRVCFLEFVLSVLRAGGLTWKKKKKSIDDLLIKTAVGVCPKQLWRIWIYNKTLCAVLSCKYG